MFSNSTYFVQFSPNIHRLLLLGMLGFMAGNPLWGQDYPISDTTIVTCEGFFWDEGLDKTYSDADFTITFQSASGRPLLLNFYIFEMRPGTYTGLQFFDGADVNAPSLGIFTDNTDYPTSIVSSGPFLTVRKTVGLPPVPNEPQDWGWKARIGCLPEPEGVHFRGISIMNLKDDPKTYLSNIAVADFDLDGDPDMVVRDTLYRNDTPADQAMHLTERRNAFGYWANAAPAVGDFDQDGDLDVFICGWRSGVNSLGSKSILFEQTDIDEFRPISFPFAPASEGKAVAIDYDQDGDLDITYTGNSANGLVFKIYKNNGGFLFSDATPVGIVGARNCGFDWTDVDGDSDLDFVIGGQTDGQADGIRLYKNNGNGQFSPETLFTPTFFDLDLRFFDDDADGDKDLYVGDSYKKIYRNTGGNFVALDDSIPFLFKTTSASNMFPADYDNDGDEDALITNTDSVRLYRNDGNAHFTQIMLSKSFPGEDTEAAWGDFDADGRRDFFVQGFGGTSAIFLNKGNSVFEKTGEAVTGFVWHPRCVAADFDGDGDAEILNVGLQYLCGGEGEPRIHIFELTNNKTALNKHPVFRAVAAFPGLANFGQTMWEWGDYNGDNQPDLLVYDAFANIYPSKVYVFKNNGNNAFSKTLETEGGFPWGSAAWVDFDKDGDLDIYIGAGNYASYFRNTGNGQFVAFTPNLSDPVTDGGQYFRSCVWTDLDGDGDADLVEDVGGSLNILYNNGTGLLNQPNYPALGFYGERLPVADFNNDHVPDCLISNQYSASVLDSTLNRRYIFGKMPRFDKVVVGDFNEDGLLDYAWPTPFNQNEDVQMTIWLNQGNFFFKPDTLSLTHLFYYKSDHAALDFDLDGDLDLVTFDPIHCHDFSFAQNVSDQARRLNVVFPNGGGQILAGEQTTVSWVGHRLWDNAATAVSLSYSLDGGLTFTDLGEAPTNENGGSFQWNVPNILSKTCLFRVKSLKNDLADQSDFNFEITDIIKTFAPNATQKNLLIFPNPTNNLVFLKDGFERARVLNFSGKQVLEKYDSNEFGLDVSTLPSGVYWLEIFGKNSVRQVGRFVKI